MSDTYYISACWKGRDESVEACGQRLEAFLQRLARIDPLFEHWFDTTRKAKKLPTRLLATDLASLQQYLQRHILRDSRRQPMKGGGFTLWLRNSESSGDAAWLKGWCGQDAAWINNHIDVELPREGPNLERVLNVEILSEVLRALVLAWEPDWAVATSEEHEDALLEKAYAGTFVGWLTYHSRQRGTVPPLPAPVCIEPLEDRGTLLVLTPEPLTAANPGHLALSRQVMKLLEPRGLLQPVADPPPPPET